MQTNDAEKTGHKIYNHGFFLNNHPDGLIIQMRDREKMPETCRVL
jgi:hypothetical protein